ncbi:MAG: hypothetical protein GVY20_11870 [Bacteroidetes bacterium]|nr:hypothetical protein [Bacteroidota bacterium]
MKFSLGNIYHIYNRGNNKQQIFFENKNYHFFLKKMRNHLLSHCHLLAWCLMPNHFHWMVKIRDSYKSESDTKTPESNSPIVQPLNMSISTLLSSYTKAINNMYKRTGSLFQRRTKPKNLSPDLETDDNYPLICFLYIHQNPLKAGLVKNLQDWKYSSYRDYSGLREGRLCNTNLTKQLLDLPTGYETFIQFSQQTIPDDVIEKII